ncbi:MAG: YidC/Oxa1 family insertase periplasmic-domain containing protein [Planctomycetes bacterium]|nr:YidC/Oxa1 family insertase periplasmic-domain containing protein [Planctomycetota bacterium]
MNMRRFAWVLLALAAVLMIIMGLVRSRQEQREAAKVPVAVPQKAFPSAKVAKDAPAAKAPEAAAAAATKPAPAMSAVSTGPAPPKSDWRSRVNLEKGKKYLIGSLDPDSGYTFQVEVISDGAAINTVKLSRHYFTVEDKRLAERDHQAYEAAIRDNPAQHPGAYSLINPVSHKNVRRIALATKSITVTLPGQSPKTWDLSGVSWYAEPSSGKDAVSLSWKLFRSVSGSDRAEPVLKLTKTYKVNKDDYTIRVSLRVANLSSQPLKIAVDQAGPTGLPREDRRSDMRKIAYGKFMPKDQAVQTFTKARMAASKLTHADIAKPIFLNDRDKPESILWIGHLNKFFGSMMYLVRDKVQHGRSEFYFEHVLENDVSATQATGVKISAWTIQPHNSGDIDFELFAGPKRREMFVDESAPYFSARYKELDYVSTIDLRNCFCAFDWLSLMMIRLLQALSVVTLGNYGVAIIVLVILVRLALHPLTKKGQVAMSKMKKLAPLQKELEKKYADDKEALNRERVKLYKEQGATPLLGCLPMLLQMPILIALWTSIRASVALRHAAFLPVWITDLAAPDALFSWLHPLPVPILGSLIGTEFNLLPLLLGAAMYWQMKLNPQTQAASPDQAKQQKMMTLMMPLMMPLMFYQAASGLTLYFLVSTFFGAAEQQIIRRAIEAKEAAEASMMTTVRLPVKGPRSTRPKKPKGPNWFKRG